MGIGFFRFFLAFLVVISHLYDKFIHGPAAYAVWGFFLISGYFNALVLNKKYNVFSRLKDYFFNRVLRIYPMYIINALLGIGVLILFYKYNIISNTLNPEFYMPNSAKSILANIFLLPFWHNGLFVPVSWALCIEFWVYFLMPIIANNKQTAILATILSFIFNLSIGIYPESFTMRYTNFATCLFPFSIGVLVYMYKDSFKRVIFPKISFFTWVLHSLIWIKFPYYPWHIGLYISLVLTAWVVISQSIKIQNKVDNVLGGLSYDIYLLHTTIGTILIYFFQNRTFYFFLCSYLITILCSLFFYKIELFLMRYRR